MRILRQMLLSDKSRQASLGLVLGLLHASRDVLVEWRVFSTCRWPMHWWLLISYATVISLQVSHLVGAHLCADGSFMINVREQAAVPRALQKLGWALVLPFFLPWMLAGSWMLRDTVQHTPRCFPAGTHPWHMIAAWQALSYFWVLVHAGLGVVAWVLERRVRRAEEGLRELEGSDGDMAMRWGQVSRLSSYVALPGRQRRGFEPSAICGLPETRATLADAEGECAICLSSICEGDCLRPLAGCGHSFHRACIDLWLLRAGNCPLCKARVVVLGSEVQVHGEVASD